MSDSKSYAFNSKAIRNSQQWCKDRTEYANKIASLQESDPRLYWALMSIVDDVDYTSKRDSYLASAEPLVKHFEFSYKPSQIERPDKVHIIEDVKVATYR